MRIGLFCLTAVLLVAAAMPAMAVEFDFATQLTDLDNNPFRDCAKANKTDPANVTCDEWSYHTLGLIAASALNQPEQCQQVKLPLDCLVAETKRGMLARKIYPGKSEKHLVDLSASEINLILEGIGKIALLSVEKTRVVELLDPARLK